MTRPLKDGLNPGEGTLDDRIAQAWRTSTKSIGNGQCVEAAKLVDGYLAVRDTKDRSGPTLRFAETSWRTFIAKVKNGNYDNS